MTKTLSNPKADARQARAAALAKATATQDYVVTQDGFVGGRFRKAGTEISLTEAQAKYERVMLKSELDEKAASKPKSAKA